MSLTASLGAPCFQALTRPVSMMGLPLTYVVLLAMGVMGGFIRWSGLVEDGSQSTS